MSLHFQFEYLLLQPRSALISASHITTYVFHCELSYLLTHHLMQLSISGWWRRRRIYFFLFSFFPFLISFHATIEYDKLCESLASSVFGAEHFSRWVVTHSLVDSNLHGHRPAIISSRHPLWDLNEITIGHFTYSLSSFCIASTAYQ